MSDPEELSREELERARDLGAVTYCGAYVHLMGRELGVDTSDKESLNHMLLQMVEPMNQATEAIWRALMNDHVGKEEALIRFRKSLLNI